MLLLRRRRWMSGTDEGVLNNVRVSDEAERGCRRSRIPIELTKAVLQAGR